MHRRLTVLPALTLLLTLVLLPACGDDGDTADPSPGPQCEGYELDPEECPQDRGALEASATTTAAPLVAPPALGEGPETVVIGHRGAAGHHPDNSRQA